MTVAVVRNYVNFTSDLENELIYSSGELSNSPAIQELVSLASGDNIIPVPSVSGYTVHGVAIIPPELNTVEPILKATTTDLGFPLSAVHASVFQFGTTPPSDIVLEASAVAAGFRLIWF